MEAWNALEKLARGEPAGDVSLTWSTHVLGMTGMATWLVVSADGTVTERSMRMGQPPQEQSLGKVSRDEVKALAGVLVARKLEDLKPQGPPEGNRRTQIDVSVGDKSLGIELSTGEAEARDDVKAIIAAFERAKAEAGKPRPAEPAPVAPAAVAAAPSPSGQTGCLGGLLAFFQLIQVALER